MGSISSAAVEYHCLKYRFGTLLAADHYSAPVGIIIRYRCSIVVACGGKRDREGKGNVSFYSCRERNEILPLERSVKFSADQTLPVPTRKRSVKTSQLTC